MGSLKRVLSYTKRYWSYLFLSVITSSLYGIFAAAPTYLLKNTIDDVFVKRIVSLIIPFLLGLIALFMLKGLFMYLSNYYMNWVGNKVVTDIRNDLFEKVVYFPISFFQKNPSGKLMSHFLNDIQMIQNSASSAIKNGVRSFFEAIFLIGVAFSQNWKLSLLMLLMGPFIGFAIKKIGKASKKASISIQNNMGNISSVLQEVFIGIREVKAFNGEQTEIKRFNKNLIECFKSIMRTVQIESIGPAFIETIAILGGSVVFYIAALQIMSGAITPGQLISFFAAVLLIYQPLKRLITVYSEVQYGLAAADRIFELMDTNFTQTQISKQTFTTTIDKKINTQNIILNNINNFIIKFDNISFAYDKETPVFKNCNLEIKHGERIGIIGPSGSGKSTFCDLLLGFIKPTFGQIIIDNQDISTISSAQIRDKIGYVGQKTFLFNDTIKANIAYNQTNKTDTNILDACKAAHADEFIQKLPEKYSTIVGENGNKFSGGQKQRLTIARAILKNPQILIFDEATSALDQESENIIKLALEEICVDKTLIIVSHRYSLLEKMDSIYLVQDKEIKKISKNILYKNLESNLQVI